MRQVNEAQKVALEAHKAALESAQKANKVQEDFIELLKMMQNQNQGGRRSPELGTAAEPAAPPRLFSSLVDEVLWHSCL